MIFDDLCSFCEQISETLHYLISECQDAKSFWKEFEAFYESLTDLQIDITVKDIVIGIPTKVLKHILSYFKKYIFMIVLLYAIILMHGA